MLIRNHFDDAESTLHLVLRLRGGVKGFGVEVCCSEEDLPEVSFLVELLVLYIIFLVPQMKSAIS